MNLSSTFQSAVRFSLIAYILSMVGISFHFAREVSRPVVIKFVSGYFAYLIASYFILVTRNINNEKFDVWDFNKNHFIQSNFLLTVLLILFISVGLNYLMKKYAPTKTVEAYFQSYKPNSLILIGLLASVTVNDGQALKIFKDLVSSYLQSNDYIGFMIHSTVNILLSLVIMEMVVYVILKSYRGLITNTPSPWLITTSSFILAAIFNYTLQLGVKSNESLLERYVFPGATAYQIVVLTCVFLLIYILINRFLPATLLIIALGTIISVVNSIKVGLRGEPLLITDFIWLKEISLLSSFVDRSVIIYAVLGLLLTFLLYFLMKNRVLPGPIFVIKKIRWIFLSCLLVLSSFNFLVFRNEEDGTILDGIPIVSKLNNWVDISWMGFSKNASYKSLMYVWTKQLTKSIMDKPDGYSEAKIQEIVEKYQARAVEINATRPNNIENQTVIFILSESFADPSRIASVSLSQNVIPSITQIKEEYTSGLMLSDFYGGGTANMEIQALTGLSYSNLSSSVSVMNTEVLPKMSYIPSISDTYSSEEKIAVHLHNGANYSRNIIYQDLGFSTFIALDGTDDKPTQLENISAGASDQSTYYAVTSNLSSDSGQFFSVITMQNHIPWTEEELQYITASSDEMSGEENESLTSYARLLNITDTATNDFLNELSTYDKKITVVFYGDHLPGLYPSNIFSSNPQSQYETDYFIWSNYDTEKLDYPEVTSSDFPALLLKQTNSKVSPYYALLTSILEAENQSSEEYEALSNDLKMVQYDLTLGKSYLLEDDGIFFSID